MTDDTDSPFNSPEDFDSENSFEDISNDEEEIKAAKDAADESLKAYREALQQEWSDRIDSTNLREIAKQTKEEIARHVPDYLAIMRGLALGANSESVKYQANKWLLENALLPTGAGAKDTLTELLEEMDANAKGSSKENA
jgi:methanogenic corrinoid protein MtbC1